MFAWIMAMIKKIITGLMPSVKKSIIKENLMKKYSEKMFISGKDEVSIMMKVRKPSRVEVFFVDHPVPCDGNKHDHVEHKVHKHLFENQTHLIIKWNVGGVRQIEYIYY